MVSLTAEHIRATITVGSTKVVTPYIISFNVKKTRGTFSTFDASLKVEASNSSFTGVVTIAAGTKDQQNLIFTGIIKSVKMRPCFDDPSYNIIDLSGADILSTLEGKRFTRRSRSTISSWVGIEGVSRTGPKSGKFNVINSGTKFDIAASLEDMKITSNTNSKTLGLDSTTGTTNVTDKNATNSVLVTSFNAGPQATTTT